MTAGRKGENATKEQWEQMYLELEYGSRKEN